MDRQALEVGATAAKPRTRRSGASPRRVPGTRRAKSGREHVRVAVALGSNLGDRQAHLEWATARLGVLLRESSCSPFFRTPPGDGAPPPEFLNAACVGSTDLPPDALLAALHDLERRRGRTRPFAGAPRTLDLDLVLYGDRIVRTPGLEVPHPRFRVRRFVLEPLAMVAPLMVDPVTGRTVQDLLDALPHATDGLRFGRNALRPSSKRV